MKGTVLALGSVAALALGAAARSRAGSSSRHDLPDPHGILLNPRDPGSRGRVRRKIRELGGGRAKIDLVAEVVPVGERLTAGEIYATRVDNLSLLSIEAQVAIQRLDDRRGAPILRAYVVHSANVEPHGRGWGQILYRAMAMRAAEEDAALVSHACVPSGITSNAAENMWEKLGRSILVERVERTEDEEEMYDGPCFVAWGVPAGSFARTGGSRSLTHPVAPYFRQSAQKIRVYRGTRGACGLCPDSRGVTYWTRPGGRGPDAGPHGREDAKRTRDYG